ncbi:MAG: VanZ family protein [Candidatus Omnitrophota bacterium]
MAALEKKNSFRMKILVFYSLFILAASLFPLGREDFPSFLPLDKAVHFFMYFFLACLSGRAFVNMAGWVRISFIYAFSWGIIMELIQYYLPYRSFEWKDILSNLLGCILGIYLYVIRRRKIVKVSV